MKSDMVNAMQNKIYSEEDKMKEYYFIRHDKVYKISFLMMDDKAIVLENNYPFEEIEMIYRDAIKFKNSSAVKLYNYKNEAVKNASFLYKTKLKDQEIEIKKYNIYYLEDEKGIMYPKYIQSFRKIMEDLKNK